MSWEALENSLVSMRAAVQRVQSGVNFPRNTSIIEPWPRFYTIQWFRVHGRLSKLPITHWLLGILRAVWYRGQGPRFQRIMGARYVAGIFG